MQESLQACAVCFFFPQMSNKHLHPVLDEMPKNANVESHTHSVSFEMSTLTDSARVSASPPSHCTRWCSLLPPSAGCCSSLGLGLGTRGTTPAHIGGNLLLTRLSKSCSHQCGSNVYLTFSFSIATREMASPILQVGRKVLMYQFII